MTPRAPEYQAAELESLDERVARLERKRQIRNEILAIAWKIPFESVFQINAEFTFSNPKDKAN